LDFSAIGLHYAPVAQLEEPGVSTAKVGGSSPSRGTTLEDTIMEKSKRKYIRNKKITKDEVRTLLETLSNETKVYFGCDSIRYKIRGQWYAEYTTVLVVHKNGRNGAKIFAQVDVEKDIDQKAGRPFNRMMNEAMRVADLYLDFEDMVYEFELEHEIHLDINQDDIYGSACAVKAASGYVQGTCNVVPILKPTAYAASYAADRGRRLSA
jgi:uncharacterized protein